MPPIGENKESKVNQHVNQFNDFIKIVAEQKNIPIEEKNLTVEDLKTADEVFFTGTATGVIGVVSIDKDDISDGQVGKITSDIIDSYEDVVNAKDDNFKSYITLI